MQFLHNKKDSNVTFTVISVHGNYSSKTMKTTVHQRAQDEISPFKKILNKNLEALSINPPLMNGRRLRTPPSVSYKQNRFTSYDTASMMYRLLN